MVEIKPVPRAVRRQQAHDYVAGRKARGRCVNCGFAGSDALDWHHEERLMEIYGPKKGSIAAMVNRGAAISSIRNELRKCILLCSNCHRIHHAKERNGR